LFCPLIELIDEGVAVVPPEDLVYSTQPKKATGLDHFSYYTKGPDKNFVVAEAVAHQLANNLGLRVPEFGIAMSPDGPLFASREVQRCHRQVDSWIRNGKAVNWKDLPALIAFDIWVMNKDRNIGNLVGEEQLAPDRGKVAIIAIDFEKSMALRGPYPLTTTPHIQPAKLWPSGTLGQLLTGIPRPNPFMNAIRAVTPDQVLDAFGRVEAQLHEEVSWKESSAQLLAKRSKRITECVEEVWR
jgi:hypothetical protein